jgi:hypothetical protein
MAGMQATGAASLFAMRLRSPIPRLAAMKPGRRWPNPPAAPPDERGRVELRPPAEAHVHLGCGDVRLPGYLNVDLPPAQGVASGTSRPDVEADVLSVACPARSLAEVRLHHLFEHFDRATALALLLRWYGWLRPGGYVTIETPDFEACVDGFAGRTPQQQSVILRHVFGSQEAPWAEHLDGWSPRRFREVLGELGFVGVQTSRTDSDELGLLANVVAVAHRPQDGGLAPSEQHERALALLRRSMNGENPTEEKLFERWRARFEELAPPAPQEGRVGSPLPR